MTMTKTPITDISVHKGTTFLQHKDIIEEGDTVIIYVNHTSQLSTVVKRGVTLSTFIASLSFFNVA
jgi:hypothetical protein